MKRYGIFFWGMIFVFVAVACRFGGGTPANQPPTVPVEIAATLAPPPAATATPLAPTAIPVSVMKLETRSIQEKSDAPPYKLDIQLPQMEPAGQPWVDHFNQKIDEEVNKQIAAFKDALKDIEPIEGLPDSELTVRYEISYANNGLVSVLFEGSQYVTGAAHPFPYMVAVNYDVQADRALDLADLFNPGTNYLDPIAAYCKEDLKKQGVLEFEEGALPTAENYQVWTLQADGLRISFGAYQVGPYAAGPQKVIVPYARLKSMAPADGILARIAP